MKIVHIVGARPNFVKLAPVYCALKELRVNQAVIHTGQHYDPALSEQFFRTLHIPPPEINLGVGSGTHTEVTARAMLGLEESLSLMTPDLVVVYGDVDSTLAGALTAVRMELPLVHVEAGLRSFDQSMPEETNRRLTDHLAQYLFVTEPSGVENLRREGITQGVYLVGNVMVDTLVDNLAMAGEMAYYRTFGLQTFGYGLVTLHRPANVDDEAVLADILKAVSEVSQDLPLVFPVHPRTARRFKEGGLMPDGNVLLVQPLDYVQFLSMEQSARLVITDSGGIQEETAYLGVPCVVVRDNTERPITLEGGSNVLAGRRSQSILAVARALLNIPHLSRQIPLWDGHAAERIAAILSPKP